MSCWCLSKAVPVCIEGFYIKFKVLGKIDLLPFKLLNLYTCSAGFLCGRFGKLVSTVGRVYFIACCSFKLVPAYLKLSILLLCGDGGIKGRSFHLSSHFCPMRVQIVTRVICFIPVFGTCSIGIIILCSVYSILSIIIAFKYIPIAFW